MGKYNVLQPVAFMRDGKAVHQTRREVGNVVEVDAAAAAPLVEAGKLAPVPDSLRTLQGPVVAGEGLTETEVEADRNAAEAREAIAADQPDVERTSRQRGRRSQSHNDAG